MYWIWNRGGTMLHLCMFPLKWTWKRYNRNNYSVCSCLCLHSQLSTIPIFRCFIRAAFVVLSAICCLYLKACSTGLKSGECYGYLRTLHFVAFRSSWVSLQYVLDKYPSVDHFSKSYITIHFRICSTTSHHQNTALTQFHWHPCMPMPSNWLYHTWQMMRHALIISAPFPSPYSSLAITPLVVWFV